MIQYGGADGGTIFILLIACCLLISVIGLAGGSVFGYSKYQECEDAYDDKTCPPPPTCPPPLPLPTPIGSSDV